MPKLCKLNWCMKVLEPYSIKFSNFYKKKSDMVETMCQQLYQWQGLGKSVTHVRLDDAGETILLKNDVSQWIGSWCCGGNSQAEIPHNKTQLQKYLSGLASTKQSNDGWGTVPREVQFMVYREAFDTACKLDGITKSRYEHLIGKCPDSTYKHGEKQVQ